MKPFQTIVEKVPGKKSLPADEFCLSKDLYMQAGRTLAAKYGRLSFIPFSFAQVLAGAAVIESLPILLEFYIA